jgi:hypothetical protein
MVRPKRALLRNGLLALGIGGIPLFGVMIWLGAIHGTLVLAIGAVVLTVFVAAVVAWRYTELVIGVEDGFVREVGFTSVHELPVASVARIVIAETDQSSSPETVSQLIALGHDGQRAFRMRGLYWSIESMHAVADAIGAPLAIDTTPMNPKQFHAKYSGAAYWYEGRPWLAILGIGVAGVAAFGIVLLMMTIARGFPGS